MIKKYIKKYTDSIDIDIIDSELLATSIHAIILLVFCWLIYIIIKRVVIEIVHKLAEKTKTHWDDQLMETRFFKRLVFLIPLIILRYSAVVILQEYNTTIPIIVKVFELVIAFAVTRVIIAFINALHNILSETEGLKDKPLQSYSQLVKILIYIVFGILAFSLLTGRTPMFFITAMGAMSAIVLLIFKDTILGFIGSIQLAANDMVRTGDWITMEQYGADGDVIEITLAAIKVRNFDLTITTIPTYALISDSFKNWRGMIESPGRRIKRSIKIKIDSIRFCTSDDLEKFRKINLLSSYIEKQQKEIEAYNQEHAKDDKEMLNGRSMTNVGTFRKYVELYLKQHPKINQELTCMVRQLEPTEKGLPIEIYAFSNDKNWVNYEGIMADIFDHLLAIAPKFGVEIFQNPTGTDFQKI